MTKQKNQKLTLAAFFLCTLIFSACDGPHMHDGAAAVATPINSSFEIAADEYADLAQKSTDLLMNMDFDAWGEMLADDVEYYFPDGDAGTRTVLKGKTALLDWWKDWQKTSGIEKMDITNTVHIPVNSLKKLNYTGLTGITVMSYFSNTMVFNGTPASVRMNFATHYNDAKLIDRYYTYYDRTPIIDVMQANILKAEEAAK